MKAGFQQPDVDRHLAALAIGLTEGGKGTAVRRASKKLVGQGFSHTLEIRPKDVRVFLEEAESTASESANGSRTEPVQDAALYRSQLLGRLRELIDQDDLTPEGLMQNQCPYSITPFIQAEFGGRVAYRSSACVLRAVSDVVSTSFCGSQSAESAEIRNRTENPAKGNSRMSEGDSCKAAGSSDCGSLLACGFWDEAATVFVQDPFANLELQLCDLDTSVEILDDSPWDLVAVRSVDRVCDLPNKRKCTLEIRGRVTLPPVYAPQVGVSNPNRLSVESSDGAGPHTFAPSDSGRSPAANAASEFSLQPPVTVLLVCRIVLTSDSAGWLAEIRCLSRLPISPITVIKDALCKDWPRSNGKKGNEEIGAMEDTFDIVPEGSRFAKDDVDFQGIVQDTRNLIQEISSISFVASAGLSADRTDAGEAIFAAAAVFLLAMLCIRPILMLTVTSWGFFTWLWYRKHRRSPKNQGVTNLEGDASENFDLGGGFVKGDSVKFLLASGLSARGKEGFRGVHKAIRGSLRVVRFVRSVLSWNEKDAWVSRILWFVSAIAGLAIITAPRATSAWIRLSLSCMMVAFLLSATSPAISFMQFAKALFLWLHIKFSRWGARRRLAEGVCN